MSRTRCQRYRRRRITLGIAAVLLTLALWIAALCIALNKLDVHHYTAPEPYSSGYLPQDLDRSAYEAAVARYDAEHSSSIPYVTKGGDR